MQQIPGKLEIACFNFESLIIAQSAGADRIELCESYEHGGLTPSFSFIKQAREYAAIPLHVIIRPHSKSFIYSKQDIQEMEQAILFCKSHKIDGVVFGALTPDNTIDTELCKYLLCLSAPMSVTFHRAIDACRNIVDAIETLITLGVPRLLTSGGTYSAADNLDMLKKLQITYGSHVTLMPGGGVRSSNLKALITTGCSEFHSSALRAGSAVADASEIVALKQLLTAQS